MGENFRNDVDIALSAAQSALDAVEGADMRDLPISDKLWGSPEKVDTVSLIAD